MKNVTRKVRHEKRIYEDMMSGMTGSDAAIAFYKRVYDNEVSFQFFILKNQTTTQEHLDNDDLKPRLFDFCTGWISKSFYDAYKESE